MSVDPAVLASLEEGYGHAVVAFVGEDGYPMSVATGFRVDAARGTIVLERAAVDGGTPPAGREVNVVVSHIRPQPGEGYDQRRYVSLWGPARARRQGLEVVPERAQSWDEARVPFFQYSEITVPQAHRYLDDLGGRLGRPVRPRLSIGWLILRATRLPFLTATLVPVALGAAVAAARGPWRPGLAVLTFLGAAFVHLGLNVANDVFDTLSGADAANTTPTQFSGGSRVIHYGLVRLRTMALTSAGFYLAGIGIGFFLAATRGFWPLFWIGVVGVGISVAYTAPPFRLVHRGVGEVAVALGFGPIMVLGSFYVQAQRFTAEAAYASIPVAILIALVLYVNEIPDRAGDAAAGKRTLPVRLSKEAVIGGYAAAVAAAYAVVAVGAVTGMIARPTLLALATIPMAVRAVRGMRRDYDDPYALMPTMATNIQLHLFTGLLLFAGYVATAVAERTMGDVPAFLR